jgi:hypothetical protein
MTTLIEASTFPETAADLLKSLGGIPPQRVRMKPLLGTATEQDVLHARRSPENRLCELVDGMLVEIPFDLRARALGGSLASKLCGTDEAPQRGRVLGPAFIRLRPGLVRVPWVSFYTRGRFSKGPRSEVGIVSIVPDVVIDVFRPGNTEAELRRKRREYFAAGVRKAWLIRPESKSAEVFASPTKRTIVPSSGILVDDDVVPGFRLPMKTLFGLELRRAEARLREVRKKHGL